MGIRDFLRDQGLVTDDVPAPKPVSSIPSSTLPPTVTAATTSSVPMDDRALRIIQDKINQSSVPGYTDFVTMNGDLAQDIADPNVRARTAMKSVMRLRSLTAQQILDSVTDRIRLLKSATEHLQSSLSNLLTDQITAKTTEINTLNAERAKLEVAITELRVKVATAESQRQSIDAELRTKQAQLQMAANVVASQLEHDRDLISANLIS
jgi:hypothetical protein